MYSGGEIRLRAKFLWARSLSLSPINLHKHLLKCTLQANLCVRHKTNSIKLPLTAGKQNNKVSSIISHHPCKYIQTTCVRGIRIHFSPQSAKSTLENKPLQCQPLPTRTYPKTEPTKNQHTVSFIIYSFITLRGRLFACNPYHFCPRTTTNNKKKTRTYANTIQNDVGNSKWYGREEFLWSENLCAESRK